LEVFTVKLVQEEDAPVPRQKPGEEYVHSWVTKEGRMISHEYRRNKISLDEPPLQPRLQIFGVRPPAKAEDHQDKTKMGKFSNELRKAHMDNVRLEMSQQQLKSDIKAVQEDINLYLNYLDDKMDLLAGALGIQEFK